MQKSTLSVIVVLFVLLSSLSMWAIFNLKSSNTPVVKQKSVNKSKQPTPTSPIPVKLNNPAIKSAYVAYQFSGKVKEIKKDSQNKDSILVTDIKAPEIPKFTITAKTGIFFADKGKETKATISDLKPNQSVQINAQYSLRKKEWTTTKIIIQPPLTPSKPKASS